MSSSISSVQYICLLCDCISTDLNESSQWIQQYFKEYPYCNSYLQRQATKTDHTPGTFEIYGDPKEQQQMFINMYIQYYPGPAIFPNDNINRRKQWFSQCLNNLANIPSLTSLAFPPDLSKELLIPIDDFRKKYYLMYRVSLDIRDYQGHSLFDEQTETVTYDIPRTQPKDITKNNRVISIRQTVSLDQLGKLLYKD